VNVDDAQALLSLAREVRWDFPSSAGRPLRNPGDVARLVDQRDGFVAAAATLTAEEATELAAHVWRVWMVARDIAGGRAFLSAALDDREADPSRWKALGVYGDGLFAWWQDEREESSRRNHEALAIARAVDDPQAVALAQLGLSRVAIHDDFPTARELAAAARAAAAPLGDAMSQGPLHMSAQAARLCEDYDEAAALFEESLALNRRLDAPGMVAVELHNLGHVEIHRGNVDAAESYFSQVPHSDDPYGAAMTQLNEAAVAFRRGELNRARSSLDVAEALFVGTDLAAVAVDDRFEFAWLREQLARAGS
jgi:tetratricopeptide (TPR) repeat protein